ncbi:MAG: helix-turn-helix domain-containing protein [Actinomycetota bacterium]|nr:helix-turn-helix domain-containing protein [Actinomycetota bacterium]
MIGEEVRRRRKELGLTGELLAERAGLAPSAVSQIETGKRTPSSTSVIKLAGALGCEVGALYPKVRQAPLLLDLEQLREMDNREIGAYADALDESSLEDLGLELDREYRRWYGRLHEDRASGRADPEVYKEFDWIATASLIVGLTRQVKADPTRAQDARRELEVLAS